MSEIYIAMDKDIEQYLWNRYPIVAHMCQELGRVKSQADLSIGYKGVFNKYDDVNITVYNDIIVFEVRKDSYLFDTKTIVFAHSDVKQYEVTHW